jgi:hypothetical protein
MNQELADTLKPLAYDAKFAVRMEEKADLTDRGRKRKKTEEGD